MTLFGFLVSRPGLGIWPVRIDLCLLGFFGGFYAVPLNALIQHRPKREEKGGVIAAANLLSFVGVFLAAGLYFALSSLAHLQPGKHFSRGSRHDPRRHVLRDFPAARFPVTSRASQIDEIATFADGPPYRGNPRV